MNLFCKRCGRKLSSEVSRQRGYGSYCYSKVTEKRGNKEVKQNKETKEERIEIEGQVDILEELKQRRIS